MRARRWRLQRSPLALIAPDGSVQGRPGDEVSVRGTEAGDIASICQIGTIIPGRILTRCPFG